MENNSPKIFLYLIIISLIFGLVNGCKNAGNPANASTGGKHYGTPVVMGSGTIKSFVETDNFGKPLSIGIVLNDSALINLKKTEAEYTLDIPSNFNFT